MGTIMYMSQEYSGVEPVELVVESYSTSVTINKNSYATPAISCTKAGYYPLGIIGYNISWVSGASATTIYVTRAQLSARATGSGTAGFTLHNSNTSTNASVIVTVEILWMKV